MRLIEKFKKELEEISLREERLCKKLSRIAKRRAEKCTGLSLRKVSEKKGWHDRWFGWPSYEVEFEAREGLLIHTYAAIYSTNPLEFRIELRWSTVEMAKEGNWWRFETRHQFIEQYVWQHNHS